MKKLRTYFIGDFLSKTDDVFEQVKAEVLFNFTIFFIITNIPYIFVSFQRPIHLIFSLSTLAALVTALVILKKTSNIRMASCFFLINFTIQDVGHYIISNGRLEAQGSLFALLYILCGYLLLDRRWGTIIGAFVLLMFIAGIHNLNTDFSLWRVPNDIADPVEKGPLKYLAIIPLLLNLYLISEFVKARQKAEKQLSDQKNMIEEKQKEILDSIRYAKRIQKSLLPHEKMIEKTLDRMAPEK